MIKKLAWFVILAAAASGGCLTGSGAIRGDHTAAGSSSSGPGATTIPAVIASR